MKKEQLIIILIVVVAVAGGIFWYYYNKGLPEQTNTTVITEEKELAATLAYQQGTVQVKVSDGDWQTVETDTVLHQGDSVKTGTDSKAIVEIENGDVVRLGYNTEAVLTGLKKDNVTVTQATGASYNRVAKDLVRTYQVKAGEVTVQAIGTAFDVIQKENQVDINVVESKVKVLTENKTEEVVEGDKATVDENKKDLTVDKMNKENLKNDWYTWNKEEDSKKTDDLGVLKEYAGPNLTITSPEDGTKVTTNKITVTGIVDDPTAKLTVNKKEVTNNAGQFSQEFTLSAGKNIITVIAENTEGYKTIKEIKVTYQVAVTVTPIKLEAETESDGVHLEWNESKGPTFQYYKVVRSETNAELKYPDDGYIAVKNKGEESYVDTTALVDKNYYYRVCEVMSADKIFCSNVVYMKGKEVPTTNTNTSKDEEEEEEVSGIKLSGKAEDDGIHLSWTVTGLTIKNGFKLVKSEKANPVYPGNDYQYLEDSSARSYTWALTDGNTYHFRACQYNGDGKCLVYSNDITVTAQNVTPQYTGPDLSALAQEDGVGLWWTDKSDIPGFNYYKVVRSETNADLKYPDDSYIAVKSEGENSHRDYSAVKGKTYYYRICAVAEDVYCGNVVQVTAINENTAPQVVSLSATYSEGKVNLAWTASNERDFQYYKIVWSQTKTQPVYPTDGYLEVISDKSKITYTDTGTKTGTRKTEVVLSEGIHYYSVCVVDGASQVTCSNVVTLVDGAIQ